MLEQLLIFTRGGLILWACREFGHALKGSPIDTLIRSCLLEERSGTSSYHYDAPGTSYTIKWTFQNELGLVFVAVYQRILQLLYVDDLLSKVKQEFVKTYDPKRTSYNGFDDIFQQLKKEAESCGEKMKISKQLGKPVSKTLGRNQDITQNGHADGGNEKKTGDESESDGGDNINLEGSPLQNEKNKKCHVVKGEIPSKINALGKENGTPDAEAFNFDNLRKLKCKGGKKTEPVGTKASRKVEPKKKMVKMNRVGDDSPLEAKLDFSESVSGDGEQYLPVVAEDEGKSKMDKEEIFSSDSEEEDSGEDAKVEPKKKGWFSSMIKSISGKAKLEKDDLEPALKALKDMLMTKNVAQEIAEKLCESVGASLQGKKQASFTRISSTVKVAMEDALVRILTPKRSIDILRDVHAAKEKGIPYVVVFTGVNGVGKSTNLAKVAYWLRQHKMKVMMAACDTFRSGAVEQLRVHACRLQIPLFEKGYEKDPTVVAKQAIEDARKNGSDVVLIDTAGRMQGNTDLMKALAKLIYLNTPDLVLFVGEALVGNDGVDQLSQFNQKLGEFSHSPNPRLIDGILLTKFDTIDEKVGAAVSMAHISGSPIMFVGCGQSYADLKKLNVKAVVNSLLN